MSHAFQPERSTGLIADHRSGDRYSHIVGRKERPDHAVLQVDDGLLKSLELVQDRSVMLEEYGVRRLLKQKRPYDQN